MRPASLGAGVQPLPQPSSRQQKVHALHPGVRWQALQHSRAVVTAGG